MALERRYVLGGLLALLLVAAWFMLERVIGTVFFAITVAYLLTPLRTELIRRGLGPKVATALATLAAFLTVVVVTAPIVLVIVARLSVFLDALNTVPSSVDVDAFGATYTLTLADTRQFLAGVIRNLGREVLTEAPVLFIKLTLFGFLVFALLLHSRAVGRSGLSVVPPTYRDAAKALNERARATLTAIYVLQVATAAGTFLISLPVFFVLGYEAVITLSTVAAILQFVPLAGPSFLLGVLAVFHIVAGEVGRAILAVVVGGFFVAWLPDIVVRPRLAERTADLPGSLYFLGFIGGLLSLGAIGIIAGPLVVALVVEAGELLSEELNDVPVRTEWEDDRDVQ